jgi:heat shock protein HslJ
MKKLTMVLPLAILLAYCSGPNNTQTTDTDVDATSTSASTTATTDMATTSSDVSDATTTISSATLSGTDTGTNTTSTSTNTSAQGISASGNSLMDPNDPMYQHWQRTNAQHWTYDMDYPGYDRPIAGSYNTAVNGNWQLVMTPELVTAWRQDNSRSLWTNGSNTYVSASESFNTQNDVNATSSINGTANLKGTTTNSATSSGNPVYNDGATIPGSTTTGTQGSVQVNGSTNAATLSSGTNAATHGQNNNASANATVANQMNGGTANSSANTTVSSNTNTTSGTNTGTTGVNGSASGTVGSTGSTNINAGTSMNGTTGLNNTTVAMDVNSISYNAANGNMYQLPKFNLFLDNGSFTGYTGCNGISGRVEVTGTSIRFLNTNTSTAIDCMGGLDETVLLDILKRVDSYTYVGDELQLMQGSQVLLKFKKTDQDSGLR